MSEQDKESIRGLVESKDVDGLVAALTDKDMDARREAACALGEIGDEKAVEPLVAALNDTTDYPVVTEPLRIPCRPVDARVEAALALGKIGGESALVALRAVRDTNAERGVYTGLSLAEAVDKALFEMGAGDFDAGAIRNALVSGPLEAQKLDDSRVTETVVSQINNYGGKSCEHALMSLKQNPGWKKDKALREKVSSATLAALKHNNDQVRKLAVEVLAQAGGVKTLHELASRIGWDASATVQTTCLEEMWRISSSKTTEILTAKIKSGSAGETAGVFRSNWDGTAQALVEVNEPWTVELLALMLTEEGFRGSGPWTRAALHLGGIKDKRAINPLKELVREGGYYGDEAARVLGKMRGEVPAGGSQQEGQLRPKVAPSTEKMKSREPDPGPASASKAKTPWWRFWG